MQGSFIDRSKEIHNSMVRTIKKKVNNKFELGQS